VLGLLENTLVIVTSDHGHTIWERRGYIGKRGYPSDPEVTDIPTFARLPSGVGAGTTSDAWIQHHDIAPTILDALGVAPREQVDGRSFWGTLLDGTPSARDHVVIGWGTAMTVITERWWFNAKVDGTGPLLFDRTRPDGFDRNVADEERSVCRELFGLGRAEARDGFPAYLLELAKSAADAPGCSPFAAG
jgi:arylsulfatase A-like enzyme